MPEILDEEIVLLNPHFAWSTIGENLERIFALIADTDE